MFLAWRLEFMVLFHVGLALVLLVLVTSVSLIIWSSRAEPGPGIVLAKVVGIIVFVLAILDIISLGVGVARWKAWGHHQKNACHCPATSLNANPNPNPNQMQNQTANLQPNANPVNNNTPTNNQNANQNLNAVKT